METSRTTADSSSSSDSMLGTNTLKLIELSETSVSFPIAVRKVFRRRRLATFGRQSCVVCWQSSRCRQPVIRIDMTRTSPLCIPGNMIALKCNRWPKGDSAYGACGQMSCIAGFRQPREVISEALCRTSPVLEMRCSCTSLSLV